MASGKGRTHLKKELRTPNSKQKGPTHLKKDVRTPNSKQNGPTHLKKELRTPNSKLLGKKTENPVPDWDHWDLWGSGSPRIGFLLAGFDGQLGPALSDFGGQRQRMVRMSGHATGWRGWTVNGL